MLKHGDGQQSPGPARPQRRTAGVDAAKIMEAAVRCLADFG